jgi:hypothetical protein
MKKHACTFLFILFLYIYFNFFFSSPTIVFAASCTSGYIGSECCDLKIDSEDCAYCIEGVDWGYCSYWVETGPETEICWNAPANCSDVWSNRCCCNGTAALNCTVPDPPSGGERSLTGTCGRINATIDCDGNTDSHHVCNTTYYPTASSKCVLMQPAINSYSVTTPVIIGNPFSITVSGDCPNGLLGNCLIECRVIHPDGHIIELDTWSSDDSVVLPSVTCDQIGDYIVDYCGVYTDFHDNKGWGDLDDTNKTVKCTSTPEFVPPNYSFNYDNSGGSVAEGTIVKVYAKWNDSSGLSNAILRDNKTGWKNVSSCYLSGTSNWCNKTITTIGYAGKTICWKQWANDTFGNWNNTMPAHCFSVIAVPDTTPPTYSFDEPSGGSVESGTELKVSVYWQDSTSSLDVVEFYHNISGSMNLIDTCSFSSQSGWCNKTIDTKDFSGVICWKQTANDTLNNLNNTMTNHCSTVVSSTETETGSVVESIFESIRKSISASSAEFSVNFLVLAFQAMGIVILIILIIIVVQQLVQSMSN